ncbi:hypothetical protein FB451DRAFT_1415998 [Mycena latifolia]|nr:hypothetical protein FB451DRAFT_1415998 [Mycena latifolia]
MREVLLQDQIHSWHEENLEAESGRHGVITDGTHDFFKQGILLVSLVFSQVMMRWAPVLFTWLGKFDELHHKSHFDQLIFVIAEQCTRGLGYVFDERPYSAVLDFSSAQRNGFILAFVDYMCARIPGWSTLSEESRATEAKLPSSTNAGESGHWLLYRAVGTGFDLWEGIRRLYRWNREIEMLHGAILAGHVDARFQGSKPQPKSRLHWHENDGRAPDTRERLAALETAEQELAARNSALTDEERWIACNAAPSHPPAPPPPNLTASTALARQSYIWDANSCFIDAPLEAYFRAFVAMGDAVRADFLRRIRADAPETGLRTVVEHLWLRGLLSDIIESPARAQPLKKGGKSSATSKGVTKPSKKKLAHALVAGQLNVKMLIETKWDGGRFVAGMAGCSLPAAHIDPELPGLVCPLVLKLGADVEYQLISRVVYIAPDDPTLAGHYVTKTRLKNSTYFYNDLQRDGALTEIGPLYLLEEHDRATSWVLYLRTSKHRNVADIQADFLKLPNTSQVVTVVEDSDDELDKMLIDSITSPVKSSLPPRASLPPLRESFEDSFFMPEQSPAPAAKICKKYGDTADVSLAETNSNTPCPLWCDGCGEQDPEGDDDPDEVQCEKCLYWVHIRCQFSDEDWHDPDVHFICKRCGRDPFIDIFKPDQIVMLPQPQVPDWRAAGILWYPARFITRHERRAGQLNE